MAKNKSRNKRSRSEKTNKATLSLGLWKKLKKEARAARRNAYAPYSGCQIGAALLTKKGKIVSGCNVENASYGATVCAERVAIGTAVSGGLVTPGPSFSAIAICSNAATPWAPCGICRQVLMEFSDPETLEVLLFNLGGKEERCTLNDLFPYAFSPVDLPMKKMRGTAKRSGSKLPAATKAARKAARKKNKQARSSLKQKTVNGTL